jgi:two-component system, chemotaxis family, response regulator Rcp1
MNIIYVVEDNCADIRLISETLKDVSKEIKPKFFYDGEIAIKYLSKITNNTNLPIGFILDINMNKVNGFEVLAFIRKNKIIANIPVVMFSTSDAESDKKKAKSLNAEYFIKPFDITHLGQIMKSILGVFKVY